MICITCPILHKIVCIDPKCNGYVLGLIEVELIHFLCSKCIRSIWTKTNTNIITTWKKRNSHMAIGRNDNYVQWTFTADAFRKRRKRENSTVGPGFMSWHGIAVDQVSCPDTNIGVLTTRFPRASCFEETHAFCSRNMGVHVQCTCAKK
jgi:hypothetical protein